MAGWTAIEEAAAAMRRLNRAVAGRDVDDAALAAVAAAAHRLADDLEGAPARDKAVEMAAFAGWGPEGALPDVAVGAPLDFDPFSVGGGRLSPSSVGMTLTREADGAVVARTVVDPMFQGPPQRVHGGVVALLIDEVMGAVNRVLGRRAFTARLTVDFRAAAPVAQPIELRAWVHEVVDRKITLRAEGRSDEGLFVEAEGLFVVPRQPML